MGADIRRIGVIMNGVTGRMGRTQHLARSICAIRDDGGLPIGDGRALMPEPVLVGRNPQKLEELSRTFGVDAWSTDLEACLSEPSNEIYFDAQVTNARPDAVEAAIAAGKAVYCEKPVAADLKSALALLAKAVDAGVPTGVVQDKLWLPGIRKLRRLLDMGFFGRLLSVRGEFGYWVFDGAGGDSQRPSWNYRREDGGGIIFDMLPHWRYLVDNLFGQVRRVMCVGATHVPTRYDEQGEAYEATADDAAYTLMELEGGPVVEINSSWCVRVYRDDLLQLDVDGTDGSAVVGLHEVRTQHAGQTPRFVWNPDEERPHDYRADWQTVPDVEPARNAFRAQWELFLRHVALSEPYHWDMREGVKGVQLAELALESWRTRRWVDVPPLEEG